MRNLELIFVILYFRIIPFLYFSSETAFKIWNIFLGNLHIHCFAHFCSDIYSIGSFGDTLLYSVKPYAMIKQLASIAMQNTCLLHCYNVHKHDTWDSPCHRVLSVWWIADDPWPGRISFGYVVRRFSCIICFLSETYKSPSTKIVQNDVLLMAHSFGKIMREPYPFWGTLGPQTGRLKF